MTHEYDFGKQCHDNPQKQYDKQNTLCYHNAKNKHNNNDDDNDNNDINNKSILVQETFLVEDGIDT